MWVLGMEPGSSARAASALNHGAVSLDPHFKVYALSFTLQLSHSPYNKLVVFLKCMCVSNLLACMYRHHMRVWCHSSQRKAWDPVGLEMWVIVSHCVVLETELVSSEGQMLLTTELALQPQLSSAYLVNDWVV